MSAYLAPVGNGQQFFSNQGVVLSGGKIYTYLAGSTTPAATYTDSTQATPNANPIILDSSGRTTQEIWLTGGTSYKFVIKDSTDVVIATLDNLVGINDPGSGGGSSASEWVAAGPTPVYVSASQFTVSGNYLTTFPTNRRIKATVTAGTVYGYVSSSSYGAPNTTVNVTLDSGALDSGLSAVSVGLLNSVNPSVPQQYATGWPGKTQDFRLSLASGVPVPTTDQTAKTTIYCTPYVGKSISLYDGTNWNIRSSAEFSLALGTLTSGKPYDIFCYDNAGTPTLEFLVWTNDTTRATALAYQDGVLVKSGATTRRYMGTFYTTSTTTTEDSAANRYLFNYYNRVTRKMLVTEATASWTYNTNTYRQANGSSANQLNFLIGVAEDPVDIRVMAECENGTASFRPATVGIGIDSTSVNSAAIYSSAYVSSSVVGNPMAFYNDAPAAGRHYAAWLENGYGGPDTQTWRGTASGAQNVQSGIFGRIRA